MTRPNTPDTLVSVKIGMIDTPFQPMLEPLSESQAWYSWAGYKSATSFRNVDLEYFAIRNQATVFDISPMCKYRINGPDALRVMDRLVVRDMKKVRAGRVAYVMWCDEDGMVIDDGTAFRFAEDEYVLFCQERTYKWLCEIAWGFDVTVQDWQSALCGLAVQGPCAFSVLKDAGFASIEDMKPFDLRQVEPGLWISRTGYTGDLGYEIVTFPDHAPPLWHRLREAGQRWGLIPIGYEALDIARIEAGFLAPGRDFQPSHKVSRLHRGRTPFELGFGWMVDLSTGHFNGRRALLEHAAKGPRYNLVRLDIEGDAPAGNAYVYAGKSFAGHVRSAAWSPTFKRNIALADLKAPWGKSRKKGLWAEIYVEQEGVWQKRNARTRVVEGPFMNIPRARMTPPQAY
ncbi:aminomethyltransferase family protein [Ruegeria marina]|uniref:Aminomethyltransferase n=1 Tax=Ruegeria marina TaxID=639004 RepID=A0A1G6WXJ4_9RHOB|nr:aminomethyltransferase family protein [Ruegeria marina]SDD70622.1 aminomethyltransferase [Ruegeria marina]